MIGLLEHNLASLTLGSSVKGNFAVMNVRLYPEESLSIEQKESLMNRFFSTVNRFAKQSEIVLIIDDANLQSIMLICKEGAEAATAALTILARIYAENRLYGADGQLDVAFVVDQTDVFFGICGDEERYIPVVLAPEDSGAHRIPAEHGSRFLNYRESRREGGQRSPVRAPLCGPSEDGGTGYRLCGYV